ncbi:inner membrane transporter RhtA [Paraburkholderia youngii]|uniref:EamA family transporter n=1 Tax=Paraburkholderia youngii TaxID=2782701 RepID=UPI003D20677D
MGDELKREQLRRWVRRKSTSFSSAVAALLAIASMCSMQLGTALSLPHIMEYGTVSMSWLRLCFAASLLLAIVRPPVHTYSRQQWMSVIALGGTAAYSTLCLSEAVRRMPLGFAIAINFLGPLGISTFCVRRPAMLVWPVLAMTGLLLLARRNGIWVTTPATLIFPIGSAIGWAAYILLMKRIGSMFDGLQGITLSLSVASLILTPFGLEQSGGHVPERQLLSAAYLAVLMPLLPYVLELSALRRMSASAFGTLMSAEPAVAAAIGFVVLGQPLSVLQVVGSFCVVVACICAVAGDSRAKVRRESGAERPEPTVRAPVCDLSGEEGRS